VIALDKSQLLQGHLQREGPRPAEAGSDHLDGHVILAGGDRKPRSGRSARSAGGCRVASSCAHSTGRAPRMPGMTRTRIAQRSGRVRRPDPADRTQRDAMGDTTSRMPGYWLAARLGAGSIEVASARSAQESINIMVITRASTHRRDCIIHHLPLVRCPFHTIRERPAGTRERQLPSRHQVAAASPVARDAANLGRVGGRVSPSPWEL
jgi:hypothetical protein